MGSRSPGLLGTSIRDHLDAETLIVRNQLKNKNNLWSLGYLKKVKLT